MLIIDSQIGHRKFVPAPTRVQRLCSGSCFAGEETARMSGSHCHNNKMALSRVRLQVSPRGIRGGQSDDDDDDLHLVSMHLSLINGPFFPII